jgi:very-short-patch-repair endonuclease
MEMLKKGIIKFQKVKPEKIKLSRDLRKSMTPAETEFWELVRDRRMHGLKFRRQQLIDGFIVDFYCDTHSLCIEIDGGIHESGRQSEYDKARDEFLRSRGLNIIRFNNEDVLNNKDFIAKILKGIV